MGDIDYAKVCSLCFQPVSRRPEKAEQRVVNATGGFDHLSCVASPEADLLRSIFGEGVGSVARQRFASRAVGEVAGHAVTVTKGPRAEWICSCGMRGASEVGQCDKGRLRDAGLAHLRSVYALSAVD